jgi:hypothetical protein
MTPASEKRYTEELVHISMAGTVEDKILECQFRSSKCASFVSGVQPTAWRRISPHQPDDCGAVRKPCSSTTVDGINCQHQLYGLRAQFVLRQVRTTGKQPCNFWAATGSGQALGTGANTALHAGPASGWHCQMICQCHQLMSNPWVACMPQSQTASLFVLAGVWF